MNRIETQPDICNGKPIVQGTRIAVRTILSHLSAGDTFDDILDAFPRLQKEDIAACLEYATRLGDIHSQLECAS
ncbi:MAG: DUF433 domain-containing protein [Verrucomicrobia bacterium]|nr:DUF433 domain-containing protein [Verrucomicrobiota bacterium]